MTMDEARDDFFPDATFAGDQDFRLRPGGRIDVLVQLADRRSGAHEAQSIVHGRT
jgi:hypothetical protein